MTRRRLTRMRRLWNRNRRVLRGWTPCHFSTALQRYTEAAEYTGDPEDYELGLRLCWRALRS